VAEDTGTAVVDPTATEIKYGGEPPALFNHCRDVWQAMDKEARRQPIDGTPVYCWEGFTTKLFSKLRLSVPYYSSVLDALTKMGSIRQLRRGGGGSPSLWEIGPEPTARAWNQCELTDYFRDKRNGGAKEQSANQRVRDLNERVTDLENEVKELKGIVIQLATAAGLTNTEPQGGLFNPEPQPAVVVDPDGD
jgi:hypothetical protein